MREQGIFVPQCHLYRKLAIHKSRSPYCIRGFILFPLCPQPPFPLHRGRVDSMGAANFCLRRGRVKTMRAANLVSCAKCVLLGGGQVGKFVGGRDIERVSRWVGGRVGVRVGGRVGGSVGRVGGCVGGHVDLAALLDLAFGLVFDLVCLSWPCLDNNSACITCLAWPCLTWSVCSREGAQHILQTQCRLHRLLAAHLTQLRTAVKR